MEKRMSLFLRALLYIVNRFNTVASESFFKAVLDQSCIRESWHQKAWRCCCVWMWFQKGQSCLSFGHTENGFGFLIWLRINRFGLLLLPLAPLLCCLRKVGSAEAGKDRRKLEGARKGSDAFGSCAVQVSLVWWMFPPLGCVQMSTEDEIGAS